MIEVKSNGRSLVGLCCLLFGLGTMMAWSDDPPVELSGELTLENAVRLADENNPALRSSAWQVLAKEAEVKQAGVLPNPELVAEAENVGGSGELSGTDSAEYTIAISQEFALGGKRSKQVRVATTDYRLAEWTHESIRRDLRKNVASAFFDVLANQEHVALSEGLTKLSKELVETAERRVKAGGASVLEQSKAEIEYAASQVIQSEQKQLLVSSRRSLALILQVPEDTLPPVSGDLYQLNDLPDFADLKARLSENPDWAIWDVKMERSQAVVDAADAQRIPNLNAGAGWRRNEGLGDDAFVFFVGIPLPMFDRNQGARQAAVYEQSAAMEGRRSNEIMLERELSDVYGELSRAHTHAYAIKNSILPAADKSFEVSQQGYQQGRFGYLDLLDAQRTLFETQKQYIETLSQYHQASVNIERLIAETSATSNQPQRSINHD